MVDNQVWGANGVYFLWITSESFDSVTHGGEIDHRRHSGEILQTIKQYLYISTVNNKHFFSAIPKLASPTSYELKKQLFNKFFY